MGVGMGKGRGQKVGEARTIRHLNKLLELLLRQAVFLMPQQRLQLYRARIALRQRYILTTDESSARSIINGPGHIRRSQHKHA